MKVVITVMIMIMDMTMNIDQSINKGNTLSETKCRCPEFSPATRRN